jgi:hypothetical protein
MGFHGGDPIDGPYKVPGKGIVYKTTYQCAKTSQTLNDCPHSGWKEVVDGECTQHQNDAGVFCYQNGNLQLFQMCVHWFFNFFFTL